MLKCLGIYLIVEADELIVGVKGALCEQKLNEWVRRNFSDPEAMLLIGFILGSVLLLMCMGKILAPVLASVVLAYLLQSVVSRSESLKIPRLFAVLIAYGAFLGLFLLAILILWPIIWQQFFRFYEEMPSMITGFQQFLYLLPQKFPEFLTKETVDGWVTSFVVQLRQSGKIIFTASLASLPSMIALVVYVILVPLMVFFFLKDNKTISAWLLGFLPKKHSLLSKVWGDVDKQIGN